MGRRCSRNWAMRITPPPPQKPRHNSHCTVSVTTACFSPRSGHLFPPCQLSQFCWDEVKDARKCLYHRVAWTPMCIAGLLTKAKMSITLRGWIARENEAYTHHETLFSSKYEINYNIFRKIDGIKDHYVKQNKPDPPLPKIRFTLRRKNLGLNVYTSCYRVIWYINCIAIIYVCF